MTKEKIEKARLFLVNPDNFNPLPELLVKYSDQQNKALLKEVEELKEENERLQSTLSSKCFDLANELAMAGFGDDAVYLHKVHNKLLNT